MGSVADEMTIASIPLAATCLGAIFESLSSLTGKAVALMLKLVVRVHPLAADQIEVRSNYLLLSESGVKQTRAVSTVHPDATRYAG